MARRKQDDEWFWQIGAELQRLSDEVMRGIVATTTAARRFWRPNIDVCECEDGLQIMVELAGVEPDTVNVHYSPQRHAIVIRGCRDPEPPKRAVRWYQLEVFYGEFERQIALPEVAISKDGIRARFSNGMLTILIPKKEGDGERRAVPSSEE